ncbi:MAG: type II toxin-antitoxin system VapB family antitoxin [Cyclobacteriaceae bacterium]|mgnify:CR=1 FL=1|nr:type II toxin-antitoxin system VapB family antitoxin [Cyclobacteriaceae bacterium]NBP67286.1 type II toxin-antitoxin system VapB family antitoxin [Cytophagia bacterium]NBW36484.1 type II toxin-antitoxin system VapB family antitoxin [Cytophagia bacterium]
MRTNIDIDDDLLADVMERSEAKTKKEAVEMALQLFRRMLAQRDLLELRGKVKWDGDLDELRDASTK